MAQGKFLGKIANSKIVLDPDYGKEAVLLLDFQFGMSAFMHYPLSDLTVLMRKAKVNDFSKLKNIPVEVEVKDNTLISYRVLEEVL